MKKHYPLIDIVKLICAVLIVYMHCYCRDLGTVGLWVKCVLSTIGVPFFFITSGFFFEKGIAASENPSDYVRKYVKRIVVMYLIWSVITLPVNWMNLSIAHPDFHAVLKLCLLMRSFVFVGSLGVYWYLHSLMLVPLILYYCHSTHKSGLLYSAATCLFIIGVLYDGGVLNGTLIYSGIHLGFGSARNFLNVGLFYMCVGSLLCRHEGKLPCCAPLYALILVGAILVDTLLQTVTKLQFMQAITAFALFNLCRVIPINIPKTIALKCRYLSTAVYLTHFPVILVFDYYLTRGTVIDVTFVLGVSTALYIIARKVFPKKVMAAVYGN